MSLLELYNKVLQVDLASEDQLPYPIRKVAIQKGEVITAYGQVERSIYFLNTGIVEMTIRSYVSEKIIVFFFENEMLTSLSSFLTQMPSDVQMKALTDCEVEIITHHDLMKAYENSPDANKFGRLLIEQAYIKKAKREKDFLSKTAEERYFEMFATHSRYISQIPVNKIAKYLGIHPESLSRIRRKLNS